VIKHDIVCSSNISNIVFLPSSKHWFHVKSLDCTCMKILSGTQRQKRVQRRKKMTKNKLLEDVSRREGPACKSLQNAALLAH